MTIPRIAQRGAKKSLRGGLRVGKIGQLGVSEWAAFVLIAGVRHLAESWFCKNNPAMSLALDILFKYDEIFCLLRTTELSKRREW